jgi:hypothetical protein
MAAPSPAQGGQHLPMGPGGDVVVYGTVTLTRRQQLLVEFMGTPAPSRRERYTRFVTAFIPI